MLDLRPGNISGLTRDAYQRELHGNLPGALELMQMTYDSTPPAESEDRAWLLTQMGHLCLVTGDLSQAETYDAVKLLSKRYAAAPTRRKPLRARRGAGIGRSRG
jgi:hypothetical protein